jgi:hypothetical protein
LVTLFCLGLFTTGLPVGTDLLLLTTDLGFIKKHFLWFSLWVPIDSFGYPIFYGTQFNFILLLFGLISDVVLATKLYVYAVFLLAGFSMYFFSYHYTNHHAASLLAAVVFIFNPIFLLEVYAGHHTIIFGYALAPFVFLTFDRALITGKMQDIILSTALLTTLFIAGHPQTIYIFGSFLVLFALLELLIPRNGKRRREALKRVAKVSSLVIAFWVLLSAYEILPVGFNVMRSSVLFSLGYTIEDAFAYSGEVYYIYWVGIPLLVLLTVFLRKNRYAFFFSLSSLVSSIISVGPYPPFGGIFTWAFTHVPLFNMFRVAYRFSLMTALAVSFLAAFAIAHETTRLKRLSPGFAQHKVKFILSPSRKMLAALALVTITVGSGFYVAFGGFGFPLSTYAFPDSYFKTYEWIGQHPGDYRVLTVPYPAHYVDTSQMLGINRGWVWDPPVYGQAIHGKVVVTGYGGTVDTQDFLNFIGTQILYNRTDDLMKTLGTFNVKYVAVHPYQFRDKPALTEPMKRFFTLQKGLTPVYLTDNISVLENDYWTPQVFGATNYALVVGGRDVLTSLLKVDSFNLNHWVLIFANQINNNDFWRLLEEADALVFTDDGFTDLIMMSTNAGIKISAVDYAFPSSNPSKYWIPSKWWTNQGKLVLSGATLRTNASIGLDVRLNVPTKEEYTVYIRMAFAPDRGRLSVRMDNSLLATLSPYANASAGFKWVNVGSIGLDQGEHTLRLENDGSGLSDLDEIVILPTTEFASETIRVQKALESSQARLISVSEAESAFLYQELPGWYMENSIEAANGRMLAHNRSLGSNRILGNMFVPASGEYMMAARVRVATGGSMTVGVDDAAQVSVSSSDLDMGWNWVSFGSFSLVAGERRVFVDATYDAKLDEIVLYSIKGIPAGIDQLFDSGSEVFVDAEHVNSYTYKVKTQASDPFLLVLSESYHPMWKAYVDGQTISSLSAYSFVNAFFVPEGSHEITVEFTGQNYVTLGGLISSSTIICLVALVVLDRKLKKKVKSAL